MTESQRFYDRFINTGALEVTRALAGMGDPLFRRMEPDWMLLKLARGALKTAPAPRAWRDRRSSWLFRLRPISAQATRAFRFFLFPRAALL
jgi:hypothetical protein